jgi:hypothetical protein
VSHSGVACFFSKSNLSIFRVLNVFLFESLTSDYTVLFIM